MTAHEFSNMVVGEYDTLSRFARGLTREKESAEDLVQDTILKALKNRTRYSLDSNLRAWLFTIMKNTFVNNYRRDKKKKQVLADNQLALRTQLQGNHSDTDFRMGVKDILAKVKALPGSYQQAFVAHYLGYRYEEIAKGAGVPLGTIKSRIFLARKMLMSGIAL